MASEDIAILCGEACVHKYISQNLASLHNPSRSDSPVAENALAENAQLEEKEEKEEVNWAEDKIDWALERNRDE